MAVEARHFNLSHPQLMGNQEMMNPIESFINLYNNNNNNGQMGYSALLPLSGTAAATVETLLPPAYNSDYSFPQKTPMKSDSCLTCNNVPLTRKRPRDNSNPINIPFTANKSCGSFSFLGEDITLQIQQQQLDVDHLIAQQMEKVRTELEEKRKRQAKRIIEAVEIGVMKRLKAKEEEIEKIGKLNWVLEERIKSLCMENQIWRDLAQTNEATANALRTNLEQVLAQCGGIAEVDDGGATMPPTGAGALMDDAESCCGSTESDDDNDHEDGVEGLCGLAVCRKEDKDAAGEDVGGCRTRKIMKSSGDSYSSIGNSSSRLCRNCGKVESSVLILPCRHLCLCTVCGSTLHTCPICKSYKTASVHVNMS